MKILICGGHLSPALAVIEQLPKNDKVIVVGRKYAHEGDTAPSLEYQTMLNRNIPFIPLTTGRLQRKFTKHTIPSVVKMPYGLLQALVIIKKLKPDVVLSFGGYISVPMTLAAKLLKVPVVIHEQTLGVGAANKLAAKFAKKVCISWESSAQYFPKNKVVLTGNPIRKLEIGNWKLEIPKGKGPLIYITGGSTGAHAINELVEGCLERLVKKYRIIHQTGDNAYHDFDRLSKKRLQLEKEKERYMPTKFIQPEDVAGIMQEADLVISRSGMNTVTELLYYQKPSLLIPLPISQKNEQLQNAEMLRDAGLAEVVDQHSLTPDMFYQKINGMVEKLTSYKTGKSIQERADHAAENIIRVLHEVVA